MFSQRRLPDIIRGVIALAWTVLMLLPLLLLEREGLSILSAAEESIGYRYFYGLRILFGGETPWLPQGFTTGLVHHLIQIALTLAGYDIHDVDHRVQMFVTITAVTGIASAGLALYFAFEIFQSTAVRIAFAVLIFAACQASSLPSHWYLLPDYQIWGLTTGLTALWIFGRWWLMPPNQLSQPSNCVMLGLFAGLSAGIKPTTAIYALFLAIYWLISVPGFLPRLKGAVIIGAVSAAVFYVVILGFYLAGPQVIAAYIKHMIVFAGSQAATFGGGDMGFGSFIGRMFEDFPAGFLWLLPIELVVACVLVAALRMRPLVCLIPCMLLMMYFQYLRFYSFTSIETVVFSVLSLGLMVSLAEIYTARRLWRNGSSLVTMRRGVDISSLAVVVGIVAVFAPRLPAAYEALALAASVNGRAIEILNTSQQVSGRRVFYITPSNYYYLPLIYSSMCKGGTDIFSNRWGDSPFMVRTFHWFQCATYAPRVRLTNTDVLVFRRPYDEDMSVTLARIEDFFQTSMEGWQCEDLTSLSVGYVVTCDRIHPRP